MYVSRGTVGSLGVSVFPWLAAPALRMSAPTPAQERHQVGGEGLDLRLSLLLTVLLALSLNPGHRC